MTFVSTLAVIFGIAGALFLMPQVIKIYRHKSAKDISVLSYIFLLAGAVVWVAYGLEMNSIALILGNFMGGINCGLILIGCYMYKDSIKV